MMHLRILTPTSTHFEGEIESITLPGALGEMTILPGHTALVSLLERGTVRYRGSQGTSQLAIQRGSVEVRENRVVVLAEEASALSPHQ